MKNIFFLSKEVVGHMTLSTGQQADISIKVKIFHLQWAAPEGLLRLSIFFTKGKVKVNIQNNSSLLRY